MNSDRSFCRILVIGITFLVTTSILIGALISILVSCAAVIPALEIEEEALPLEEEIIYEIYHHPMPKEIPK